MVQIDASVVAGGAPAFSSTNAIASESFDISQSVASAGVNMSEYTVKDKAAIVGIGETKYYKRGQSPQSEFRLACEAIRKAADDAGIDVREIDGISGYAADRNDASRLATALGL